MEKPRTLIHNRKTLCGKSSHSHCSKEFYTRVLFESHGSQMGKTVQKGSYGKLFSFLFEFIYPPLFSARDGTQDLMYAMQETTPS